VTPLRTDSASLSTTSPRRHFAARRYTDTSQSVTLRSLYDAMLHIAPLRLASTPQHRAEPNFTIAARYSTPRRYALPPHDPTPPRLNFTLLDPAAPYRDTTRQVNAIPQPHCTGPCFANAVPYVAMPQPHPTGPYFALLRVTLPKQNHTLRDDSLPLQHTALPVRDDALPYQNKTIRNWTIHYPC
jgi:hypothetical protein